MAKTGVYKASNTGKAEYGTSSSANSALQNAINSVSKSKITVDSKYGPQTKAAYDSLINSGYTYNNGAFSKASTPTKTDPTITSTSYRSGVDALGKDINKAYDSSGLSKTRTDMEKLLKSERDRLKADFEEDAFGINSAYREASRIQGERQTKDYAGRSTGLVTSGGGFLGATQSQSGVLQNLSNEFEQERGALMAKRDAALQASRSAYNDKAFKLATQELEIAKNAEQELYDRQKDFADQKLALARESRAEREFEMGIADKKIAAYATMDDDDFMNIDKNELAQIDSQFYPGYTENARRVAKNSMDVKNKKEAISLDSDILDMRLKIPAGQKFSLGGVTYTGLKQKEDGGGGTEGERQMALKQKISSLFQPGYTIPGTGGVPYIDSTGYATPEGWKLVIRSSGLDRAEFIKQYGYLIPTDGINSFGLTQPEKEIILGKLG